MSFEVTGKLHKKYDTENKTETFRAREFVVEIAQGQYPQFVKFQLIQDRCEILDPFEEGQEIKVFFDLRGREWNGKYFTNLQAWRIEIAQNEQPAMPTVPPPTEADAVDQPAAPEDDLPF